MEIPDRFKALVQKFEKAGIRVEVQKDPQHWKLTRPGCVVGFWPNTGACFAFGKSFTPSVDTLIAAMVSGRIRMPDDAGKAVCRNCKAPIWWVTTPRGKKMPLDHDGESHWSTCPCADRHRKKPAVGEEFKGDCDAIGKLYGGMYGGRK